MEEKITLLEGDAGEILAGLSGSFDFIFMDAAKGQYINWLPDILRLLRDGGLLTMSSRTERSWNRVTRWSAVTGRSTSGCGSIYIR